MIVASGYGNGDHRGVQGDQADIPKPIAPDSARAITTEQTEETRANSRPLRIIGRLLAERKGLFVGNLSLRLVKDLLPFLGPILIGIIVDLLSGTERSLLGMDLMPNDTRAVVIVAGAMGILAVAKTAIAYVHTIVAAHMGRHVVQAARRDLAEASMQMALDERRRFNSGDLLDRCLADSKGLRSFTQNVIIRILSNTVRAIFPLVIMFSIDPILALIVLAVIPIQSGFSGVLQRRLQRQTHDARSREAAHTSAVKEAIDGWNSVASVGGQDWAAQGINETAAASEDAKIVKKHTTASISAIITLCTAIGIAAVYAVGGWRIISSGALDVNAEAAAGAMTLGTLTTFVGVAKKTYAPFQAYTKIVSNYRTGLVNLERIADVLEAPMIDPRDHGPELDVTSGDITLDNVSFTYSDGDEPTLRELTGIIPGRSLTVITGSSGAGKTTLLRLLLGLDLPDSGVVAIDDQDINKAKLSSVQAAIALVPQEPVLFTGTLSDNLLLGLEGTTTQQLLEACDRAGLLEMVRSLPKGLETEVGSGRHMLSGGQLRRMAIARALLRQPAILLLDEPTTGLDVENSMLVLGTLRRISDRTTVVMVSHRRDPLKASDHHLILRDGGWTSNVDHVFEEDAVTEVRSEPAADPAANGSSPGAKYVPRLSEKLAAHANGNGTAAVNGSADSSGAATSAAQAPAAQASAGQTPETHRAEAQPSGETKLGDHHVQLEQQVLALSAMGRPIVLNGADAESATRRIMLVSGHRSHVRPITAIAPTLFDHVAADDEVVVALASIEDVNPDGAYSPDRHTVLGVQVETDHGERRAAETRVLHDALDAWRSDLMIDVAARARINDVAEDVEVGVLYRPTSTAGVPEKTVELAQEIRRLLDQSAFSFRVMLVGAAPGSITESRGLPVVELTTKPRNDTRTAQATIEAAVATCRAAATILLQPV